MSIISELLNLREASQPIQTIVKQQSVLIGTVEEVFGLDAEDAAALLHAEVTAEMCELKPTNANGEAVKKSLLVQAAGSRRTDDMHIIKLIGKRKILVWKNRVLTTKREHTSMVEGRVLDESEGDAPKHPLTGKVSNAFHGYLSPFKTISHWIEDAKGRNVCEATDMTCAKVLCDLLNEKYPHLKK